MQTPVNLDVLSMLVGQFEGNKQKVHTLSGEYSVLYSHKMSKEMTASVLDKDITQIRDLGKNNQEYIRHVAVDVKQ